MSSIQPSPNGVLGAARTASPLLRIVGLSKNFGMTRALKGATLEVQAATIHCLLGENGAGKSTIGKIIAGLFGANAGQIYLDGVEIAPASIAEARALGISIVFQELSLAPHLSVAENICLGNERRIGLVRHREEIVQCRALLELLGAGDIDTNAQVGKLPVARQQLVEIAKALVTNPKLIILDEPTAMLSTGEKTGLFRALRNLRAAGKTFIFVTHHLEEVIEIGDHISVLRDGVVVDSLAVEFGLSPDDVLTRMGGTRKAVATLKKQNTERRPFVKVRTTLADDDIPIEISEGEIVGLYGIVGCGREELTAAISGSRASSLFEITLDRERFAPSSVATAVRHGIGYLATGRAANGILPSMSIRDNLTIGQLRAFSRVGFINGRKERQQAEEQLSDLGTRMRSSDDAITSLSGGNQQKVLLGRCMKTANRLLVLEDPTAGIDISARDEIHTLVRLKVAEGAAVLMTSSDLPETLSLCDRVYTLFGGKVVGCYEGSIADHESDIVADIVGKQRAYSG